MTKAVYALCEQQRCRSAFVVCCLDSIIPLVSLSKISSLYLASVAVQTGVSYLVANPEDRFSRDKAQIGRVSSKVRYKSMGNLECKIV